MTYYPRDSVAEKRVQLILRTVIRDSRETFPEKQGSQAAFYLHHMTGKNCSVLASFFFLTMESIIYFRKQPEPQMTDRVRLYSIRVLRTLVDLSRTVR